VGVAADFTEAARARLETGDRSRTKVQLSSPFPNRDGSSGAEPTPLSGREARGGILWKRLLSRVRLRAQS
jgi:hypothetical protein